MKKLNIVYPLLTLFLTSCQLIPITSNSDASSNPSNTSNTSNTSTPTSTTSEIITSSSETITEPITSNEVVDKTKPYNGYYYPSGTQTIATPQYYEFWHPNTEVKIEISASADIFNKMDRYGYNSGDYADRIYNDLYWPVDVAITVNGTRHELPETGMRRKGNTSRGYFFMDNNSVSDAFSFKLSFNEVWDEAIYEQFGVKKSWVSTDPAYIARDKRQFLADETGKNGLKKIDIKMYKTDDQSLVNQPFAFSLFQKYGLISPNSTLAKVTVTSGGNVSDMGVVTINETIDKDLIRRYFPKTSATGDLYKVGWGKGSQWGDWDKGNLRYEQYQAYPDMIGEEDKLIDYSPRYDAKEFDELNPHANLINLMRVLSEAQGKTPTEYASSLEAVVDIDSFLMFAALSYLTGNEDDMRNNGNNYYIYFNPGQNNKAYFIPYDYDWALGLGWNENGGLTMADISPFHSKLQGNDRNPQDGRLFLYTVVDSKEMFNTNINRSWQSSYLSKIRDITTGDYYTKSRFQDIYARYYYTYRNQTNVLAKNSNEVYNHFGGTWLFEEYYNRIKTVIDATPLN